MENKQQQPLKKVISASAEGYPLMGNVIYWSFSQMKMTHVDFLKMLEELGINKDVAPATRVKSALCKTLREITKDKKENFSRKVVDDQNLAAFGIFHSQVDKQSLDMDVAVQTKVRFDKKTKAILVEGDAEVKEQLHSLVEDYKQSYTTDQIRSAILRYVYDECLGIMVREHGGMYFVPVTKQAEFEKLEKLFEKLSAIGACSVDVIPIIDTQQAAKSMWKALVGEVKSSLSDMKEDIETLKEDPTERAQERRVKKFQDLKVKIEMYETLLNGTANDLKSQLAEIEKAFREKLEG